MGQANGHREAARRSHIRVSVLACIDMKYKRVRMH